MIEVSYGSPNFEDFKSQILFLLLKYVESFHVSSWIGQLRITLGIYPECMDLFHVPPKSNGYGSLQNVTQSSHIYATSPLLVRWLRFTSGDLTAHSHFGSLDV
jgi:hypothetical protein